MRLLELVQDRTLAGFIRIAWRYLDGNKNPWASAAIDVSPASLGSRHDFWWYLSGPSAVRVKSIDEICSFLLACGYASDPDLFHEQDFWQHPGTFEQLRKGDCEDRAIWAWRKLGELGIEARLFIGRWLWDPGKPAFHAWVVFRDEGSDFLLESTSRERAGMVRPFADAMDEYRPHFSVGHRRDIVAYGGLIEYEEWRRAQRRQRRREAERKRGDEPGSPEAAG